MSLNLVGVTIVAVQLLRGAGSENCSNGHAKTWETGIAFGVTGTFHFIIGLLLGVACSIAVFKFFHYMQGKSLIFTPWPKIQANPGTQSSLHNPTYEIEAATPSGKSVAKPAIKFNHKTSSSRQSPLNATIGIQEYEVINEEPINEAELDIESSEPFNLMPYAVHDFSEESTQLESKAQSKSHVGQAKPAKKKRRSMSDSETGTQKNPIKPPIATKRAFLKAAPGSKTATSNSNSQEGSVEFQGTYSELDKKTSYATLEPHIGGKGEDVASSEPNVKEKYSHLNR